MLDTIKGELKIFTREFEDRNGKKRVVFNACVGSTKVDDDEYINYYMPVNFANNLKKDVAKVYTQNNFDVIVKSAWIKAYRDKEENVKPILFINEATIVTNEKKAKKPAKVKKEELEPINDDNLPF